MHEKNHSRKMEKQFFFQTSKSLKAKVAEAVGMRWRDAAKLRSGLPGDTSVTIRCGGHEEMWKSRYLCFHYYYTAAFANPYSSEGDRYWMVTDGLLNGDEIPQDDVPVRKLRAA